MSVILKKNKLLFSVLAEFLLELIEGYGRFLLKLRSAYLLIHLSSSYDSIFLLIVNGNLKVTPFGR